MAADSPATSWATKAEAALRTLRDVEGVSVQTIDDEITEVHVVTGSARPAKQIVRDVQTLLRTRFGRSIDHRVVSVAYVARELDPRGAVSAGDAAALAASDDRVRFDSVNVYVSGARATAQVELRWKGVVRMGSASGWGTRAGARRLVAAATVAAVQDFLDGDVALGTPEVELARLGRARVAVVGVALLAHRQEKWLVGSCTVERDTQQAVALATLAALNRVLGGLRTREPTEYVLRPTSTMEDSGAKRR